MASTLRNRTKVVDVTTGSSFDDLPTFTPPNFTIKELLNAIPKQCFERSAIRSSAYLLMDFAMVAALGTAVSQADKYFGVAGSVLNGIPGQAALAASWLAYWWFQGLVCTGIWVIAHECGHQAYSTSKIINNTVGWVLHSALLVPYHSWRISHARHHAATGHMTRDEVFVPKTLSQLGVDPKQESLLDKVDGLLEDAPLYNCISLLAQQTLGWPMYLIRNASGQKTYPAGTNHFNPNAVIFDARHYWQIIWSDIGIALAFSALYYAVKQTSVGTVVAYYGIPYLLVNHWLVCITFLQHTDVMMPHYRAKEWNFQRGALCTQDRNVYNFFTHDIASTHVAHHLSSKIPHYHGKAATEALKNYLGDYYMYTPENWLVSLYKSYSLCKYVDAEDEVVFYRNAKGKQSRRVVYESTSDSGIDVNNKSDAE